MLGRKDKSELLGKVVVITGASSGFGKGAVRKFAEAGASVVLAARRDHLLDELVGECTAAGGQALAVPTDVSIPSEVEALANAAIEEYGRIDVWVNDAGVAALGRFEEVPLVDHMQVIGTDFAGTVAGSYYAMREFRKNGTGVLINIASGLGKIPAPYYATYTAAKYGVVGLSASLRQELEENDEKNIHVCTVMPMAMDTSFFEHAANYTGHEAKPIPPTYDAEMVVDTIFKLATQPEAEVTVGGAGVVMGALHNLIPGVVEKMMGKEVQTVQVDTAGPAPHHSGSVHAPVEFGTEVHAEK